MLEFIIHSVPGSPYGRAVLSTFEEKGASYRLAPLPPGAGRSQEHLARHPFGKMPVLEHGGFMLYETQAILRYLDRVLPAPALTPVDPKLAARMDQLLNICDWYLMQGVNNVIGFQRIIGPRVLGLVPDEEVIASAMPKAHVLFNELSRLLGGKSFLADGRITLADLMIAPHIDMLSETVEWRALTAENPNIVAWLERMNARPSLRATTWERVEKLAQAT